MMRTSWPRPTACRLEAHALRRAQLRLNPAKTRVWNSGGAYPEGVQSLAPNSEVWVGDQALASGQCGIVALGVPLGAPEFVAAHLAALLAKQRVLLDRLPLLADTQVAWLLLLLCRPPRAVRASHLASREHASIRSWAR